MNTLPAKIDQLDWHSQVPHSIHKHVLFGLFLMIAAFGGFGYWAFSAPLAAAVISPGSFVATGQNKVIQHLEGGIIKKILISEGDHVQEGQPLLQLDETAARANNRQLLLRIYRLEAIKARLETEARMRAGITFPRYLVAKRGDPEIKTILDSQLRNFLGSKRKLESDLQLIVSNTDSLKFRKQGYIEQEKTTKTELEILAEDLLAKEKLLKKGFIRRPEVNAIKRSIADARGDVARLSAQASETQSQIDRLKEQKSQVRETYRQTALDELQTIEAELDTAREQARNAKDILERSIIHAPVAGTVVRLNYHTSGGVVESGKGIMEILPRDAPLIIETQIGKTDIDSIRVGENAIVRLTALNRRTTPVLNGKVIYVSADALKEENPLFVSAKREVYLARVEIGQDELHRIPGFKPTPGMPVEVMIKTAERTFIDYLSRPVVDSMSKAFREQ